MNVSLPSTMLQERLMTVCSRLSARMRFVRAVAAWLIMSAAPAVPAVAATSAPSVAGDKPPATSAPINEWLEPRTLVSLIGPVIGISGFLFGILCHRWSRRESRLDALGRILLPMVRSAQCLYKANSTRRRCEQMKCSYPDPASAPEAARRVNAMVDEYGQLLSSSEVEFRSAESEFAARYFRFPDGVSRAVKSAQATLSELGRLVNAGLFDKADLQLAKFRDEYRHITDTARGWRLADPFEGIKRRFRDAVPATPDPPSEFELTEEEMNGVLELVQKRVTTQCRNAFVVHPPKVVINNPSVLKDDRVVEILQDAAFLLVFQDGTTKLLSLPELIVFTYNLIVFAQQASELDAMIRVAKPQGERTFEVSFKFSMKQLMQPEMVKVLLEKVDFANTPSDA